MFERISNLSSAIKKIIYRGHQRSVRAKKNIVASFLIKGISVLIAFYMVPLTIGYVQKEQYGIWLTLSSVVGWFSFFDIGLGLGLRNRLAEAMANDEWEKAKIYVSSTYAILGFIVSSVLILFFIVEPWLNWQTILNTQSVESSELRLVAIATFSFFCINFIFGLIDSIFYAYQKPAYKGIIRLVSNIITLAIIVVLTKTTQGSLFYLALTLGISPMIVLIFVSIFMFKGEFRPIAPSFVYVRKKYFKDLVGLGARFFLLSLSGIIIFSTDNIIITQLFGPGEVPAYAVAHKYFGLITVGFSFILVPTWSAHTEAYAKNDINWVTSIIKKLIRIWYLLIIISFLMFAVSDIFYGIWVPQIQVSPVLSGVVCLYVIVLAWNNIFINFINGVGKIQLQLILSVIFAIVNIPLSYFFAKVLGWGSAGVMAASIVCIAYGPILAPIQYKKIIKGTASGIWNR